MKLHATTVTTALVAVLHAHTVVADLPVHCAKWQVLGTWNIKVTESIDGLAGEQCGHPSPDTARAMFDKKDSWENPAGFSGIDDSKVNTWSLHIEDEAGFSAKLCRDPKQIALCETISWSMVYDQGMLLTLGKNEYIYFSFRFMPKDNSGDFPNQRKLDQFVSFCDESLSGSWVKRSAGKMTQGCVIAKNTVKAAPHSSDAKPNKGGESDFVVQGFLELQEGAEESISSTVRAQERAKVRSQARSRQVALENERFMESEFQVDRSFVKTHNSDLTKSWTADYDAAGVFAGLKMREMLMMAGAHTSSGSDFSYGSDFLYGQDETDDKQQVKTKQSSLSLQDIQDPTKRNAEEKRRECIVDKLPKEFDWTTVGGKYVDVVPEIFSQESCGSCFAVAASIAMSARYRIVDPVKNAGVFFASQQVLDCSPFQQSCVGGFPVLVGLHAFQHGMQPDDQCFAYRGTDADLPSQKKKCSKQADASCGERVYVDSFDYVGGAYGFGNEADMMRELYNEGPIVVGINVPHSMHYYSTGVFTAAAGEVEAKDKPMLSDTHESYWERTNHAVVAVGWGETAEGQKYWKIMNSWGKKWGDEGFFKVARGVNEIAVEAMPVAYHFAGAGAGVDGGVKARELESCGGGGVE